MQSESKKFLGHTFCLLVKSNLPIMFLAAGRSPWQLMKRLFSGQMWGMSQTFEHNSDCINLYGQFPHKCNNNLCECDYDSCRGTPTPLINLLSKISVL